MTRRTMLGAAGAVALAQQPPARRLNVLFIIADDLNTEAGCCGAPVRTPNLDQLAARGVRFDRAYCQYPLCNPSRTSFLSGLRPESTGVVTQNRILRTENPRVEFMPDFFKKHGYFTAGAGKVFHHGKQNAPGFDEWLPAETSSDQEEAARKRRYANAEGNRTPDWAELDGPESDTADAIAARDIIRWMESSTARIQPFFLVAGFRKPHLPWAVPRRYFDMYPSVHVPAEPPMHGIPKAALITELGPSRPPEPRWKAIAAYRAAVSYMDAQTGALLGALDRLKIRESTVVVLIGDNGFHLGEHLLWSKHTLFERATRVPMIFSGPGIAKGVCKQNTELLDVYPSLAELTGLPRPAHLQGTSLMPLLRRPDAAWDRPARSIAERNGFAGRAVRSGNWRYVEWNGGKDGVELYDHREDPGEYNNLAGNPGLKDTIQRLRALL